jgi:hypothetical protein
MVWKTIRGRRVNVRRRKARHLYSNKKDRAALRREFTERYGAEGERSTTGESGREIYGAVVGKVRREQVAAGTRSSRETIPAHWSRSRKGKRFRVKKSVRYI